MPCSPARVKTSDPASKSIVPLPGSHWWKLIMSSELSALVRMLGPPSSTVASSLAIVSAAARRVLGYRRLPTKLTGWLMPSVSCVKPCTRPNTATRAMAAITVSTRNT